MKSAYLKAFGELTYGELPKPTPKDDQLLIKLECAVINPSDVLFISGKTVPADVFPFTPGWEGAGTIVEVGKDHADKGLVGKRVGCMR